MRKLLIGLVAGATTVVVAAVGADFSGAIYAEYRFARSVRAANDLPFDPWVSILGFPFITQATGHLYTEAEIRAGGVDHPIVGKASIEATLHSIDLTESSWLVEPAAKLPVGKLESRIIVDSTHVGRFMGIKDLLVEAPPKETNDATGGTTESGISDSRGLVFTGTPSSAGLDERVSVSVDLSTPGGRPDHLGLHRHRRPHRCRHCRPAGARRQEGGGPGCVRRQDARNEAAVRGRTHHRGRPRFRHHHRGHHRGSNHRAGRVRQR